MWQIYQFPLCPFSRKVRLLLSEKGVAYDLVRENPWELREEFQNFNPAGRTPVLHNPERQLTLWIAGRSANISKRRSIRHR